MAYYHKYRPQTFSDLVGQDHVSRTLLQAVKGGKLTHAYLLTGPRGTGKTTTARLLAKAINCLEIKDGEPCNVCGMCQAITSGRALDVIEIDAASHTGVDEIREIIDKARLVPSQAKKKVYIIDEVHMLSKSAFNALLKTLEEPPSHVVFVLATTEVHKLPATIISRTQRYDFKRVSRGEIVNNLSRVAKAEGIKIDFPALELLALAAAGGHRDALGLLEQAASFGTDISKEAVETMLGLSKRGHIYEFLGAIFNTRPEEGLKIAHRLYEEGIDMSQFHKETVEVLRQTLLLKICGDDFVEETAENITAMKKIGIEVAEERILEVLNVLLERGKLFKEVANQLLPIEMAIFQITKSQDTSTKQIPAIKTQKKDVADEANSKSERISRLHPSKADSARDDSKENPPEVAQGTETPVYEMTKDIWDQVMLETKKENTSLAALLRDAKPVGMSGNTLILGVKFAFHKDRISEIKNREVLEKIVSGVMGQSYVVTCQLRDPKSQEKDTKPASDEDLQAAVGEVFELEA